MPYDNTNSGALFKNDRKEKPNQPDYTGNMNVDGVEKRLSAWIKKDRNGRTYLSLSVQDKMTRHFDGPKPDDEDIPF